MTSRRATPYVSEEAADGTTNRAGRRQLRRTARRRTIKRTAGLVGTLVVGVSATAAGVSTHPSLPQAGAADSKAISKTASPRVTQLPELELAVAQRSVIDRPVEGVLLTHAAVAAEQAKVAAAVAAAQAAQAAAEKAALTPHTGVNWDGIAECETGGNWSMSGSSFSGGLGFANTTWRGFGGGQFASNAGYASREQQIVVAERVYARYGLSGWGCRRAG